MRVSFSDKIAYTSNPEQSNRSKERKDAEKKAVTGGGAIAATTAAARTKAAKSGFDMFNSAKKASQGLKAVKETTKTAANVTKQTKGLWVKVAENARWAKDAILNWGAKFKNMRIIKPIVRSPLFRGAAAALGYGFGFVTLISGLSDITKVTTEAIEGKLLNNED